MKVSIRKNDREKYKESIKEEVKNISVHRGDIFLADLDPIIGLEETTIRPVVIIQNDIANKYMSTVIIAPVTSRITSKKIPTHVEIHDSDSCLGRYGVILLERVRIVHKIKLKRKIGRVDDKVLEDIDNALAISVGITKDVDPIELQMLEKQLSEMSKPLVITEGKTDEQLIETAWKKIYPNKKIFFDCQSSGVEIQKQNIVGNAQNVRRTIELNANISNRPTIGLFDNDREGNEQFKGLNKKAFEAYDIKKDLRKHLSKNIWGMLLPVPDKRKLFVTDDDITQRYFVIEHYFSDDILKKYSMYGRNILGTSVFKVNNKKDMFSKEINNLPAKEFENFRILFTKIETLFNIKY